jgi:holo-[acyl-carrier protein] synthase
MSTRIRAGCDVVELAEIENSLNQFGDRYLRMVFTPAEIDACSGPTRIARLAARFAAKEATIKAFATPDASFPLPDIEVVSEGPVPRLRLLGSLARLAAEQGWTDTALSLSHSTCHASAALVVLCDPPQDERF